MTDFPRKPVLLASNDRTDRSKVHGKSTVPDPSRRLAAETSNKACVAKTGVLPPDLYDWDHVFQGGARDGNTEIDRAARVYLTRYLPRWDLIDRTLTSSDDPGTEQARKEFYRTQKRWKGPDGVWRLGPWSTPEVDAAADMAWRATRDRLLLAAADVAHEKGSNLASFLEAAELAFDVTDPAAYDDEEEEEGFGDSIEDDENPDPACDRE